MIRARSIPLRAPLGRRTIGLAAGLVPLLLGLACTGPGDVESGNEAELARGRGRELYLEHCVACHGENADGNGQQREWLDPPPRDYTDPSWRASATAEGVFAAISDGVGSSMPAWRPLLSELQIQDLATYVLSVAEQGPWVDEEAAE